MCSARGWGDASERVSARARAGRALADRHCESLRLGDSASQASGRRVGAGCGRAGVAASRGESARLARDAQHAQLRAARGASGRRARRARRGCASSPECCWLRPLSRRLARRLLHSPGWLGPRCDWQAHGRGCDGASGGRAPRGRANFVQRVRGYDSSRRYRAHSCLPEGAVRSRMERADGSRALTGLGVMRAALSATAPRTLRSPSSTHSRRLNSN